LEYDKAFWDQVVNFATKLPMASHDLEALHLVLLFLPAITPVSPSQLIAYSPLLDRHLRKSWHLVIHLWLRLTVPYVFV